MKEELEKHLPKFSDPDWVRIIYKEDINPDALTDQWLKSKTSYIWRVGVLVALDANKCDWIKVIIGTQRSETSPVQIIGKLDFKEGENDDVGRVLTRARDLLEAIHVVFDDEL